MHFHRNFVLGDWSQRNEGTLGEIKAQMAEFISDQSANGWNRNLKADQASSSSTGKALNMQKICGVIVKLNVKRIPWLINYTDKTKPMKTDRGRVHKYAVPVDILMDIWKSQQTNCPTTLRISPNENILWLIVKYPADQLYCKKAKQNIEAILSDYEYFANGSPEDREFGVNPYEQENDFSV